MKISAAQPLAGLLIFLLLILMNFGCIYGCGIQNYWVENRKEYLFSFKARETIRKSLKEQQELGDFLNKTKIQPIRITFNSASLSQYSRYTFPLTHEKISYLESILKDVVQFFSGLIKVLPQQGNNKFIGQQMNCYNQLIPNQDKLIGIPNSDLHIYLGHNNEETSALASASYCQMGVKVGFIRPTFGHITFYANTFFKDNITDPKVHQLHFKVVLHEILHILGFDSSLFSYFLESNQIHLQHIRGLETAILGSPRVLETAKKYFNCSTLCGMQLENQGSEGSINSHWETTILNGELMNPQAGMLHVLSIFTVKFLQDTGFYSEINEKYASEIYWGKNKGCEFVEAACNSQQVFPEFHQYKGISQCNFLNEGYGHRDFSGFFDGHCQPTQDHYVFSCKNEKNFHAYSKDILLESFSPQSKCFNSNIYNSQTKNYIPNYQESNTRCLQFQCLKQNQEIQIFINISEGIQYSVLCQKDDTGKQILVNNDFINTKTITCPNDYEQFCQKKSCPDDCSHHGFCIEGRCICNPGYASSDCSLLKYVYPINICKLRCQKGYFMRKEKCMPCHLSCSKCKGPRSNQCTACHLPKTLSDGRCV